jgi:hypothetical protein
MRKMNSFLRGLSLVGGRISTTGSSKKLLRKIIPYQTITGWRMYIDYQKLKKATQKDHFPLPFIDEMLERLANHSICYLDGYSGYHQILIHPDD